MESTNIKKSGIIRIVQVTGGIGRPTERRELSPEEIEEWKKEHFNSEHQSQYDVKRQAAYGEEETIQ